MLIEYIKESGLLTKNLNLTINTTYFTHVSKDVNFINKILLQNI